jgi:hypothetical protein
MRSLLFTTMLLVTLSAAGQSGLPPYQPAMPFGYAPMHGIGWSDNGAAKKWSLQPYAGFSTSYMFFRGGSAMVFSAPMGLQLTRRLNDNFYAFAGASIAPAYSNFNQAFSSGNNHFFGPPTGYFSPNGLGVYSRAEMGLMYVNDQRTFSISGSISVQRGSSPYNMPRSIGADAKNNTPISHH